MVRDVARTCTTPPTTSVSVTTVVVGGRTAREAIDEAAYSRSLRVSDAAIMSVRGWSIASSHVVTFFSLDITDEVGDAELEREYARRGLKAAGLFVFLAVFEAYPTFLDSSACATHWQGPDGQWYFCAFRTDEIRGEDEYPPSVERHLFASRRVCDWGPHWVYAGVSR